MRLKHTIQISISNLNSSDTTTFETVEGENILSIDNAVPRQLPFYRFNNPALLEQQAAHDAR